MAQSDFQPACHPFRTSKPGDKTAGLWRGQPVLPQERWGVAELAGDTDNRRLPGGSLRLRSGDSLGGSLRLRCGGSLGGSLRLRSVIGRRYMRT